MKLPQYSGKVLEFPTFWAQFEASIYNRSDLDAATKFTYLISSTKGRARSSIEGIPLTAANYPQAVSILKARFGRPRMVVREHLTALWKLPACSEMSMRGIQSLVDEVTKHLRCLVALNRDPFAGPLPLSEFTHQTIGRGRRKVGRKVGTSKDSKETVAFHMEKRGPCHIFSCCIGSRCPWKLPIL
ncbi:hypothetical protein T06_1033 [Trichinella sp. T6]|nr:hypothetical protein T06_1033 [Trichinella sp. T6]